MPEDGQSLKRFPRALAWGLLGLAALYAVAEALGPHGFTVRDESISLFLAQRWRLGAPLETDIGGGTLLYALQGWAFQLSGAWQSLHWPVLAAWLFQGCAISAVAKRLGAQRAAQGAFFAAWLAAAALLQARSLLHFAMLPAFLSAALLLSFGPLYCGILAGAIVAAGLLEYEAILFALPGIAAFTLLEPRLKRSQRWAPWLGFALAAPVALWLARRSLFGWWTYRLANNGPAAPGHAWGHALWQWAFGGEPEAYLGLWHHSSFAAWALPFVAWGLWSQGRRRPWLWIWAAFGLLTLLAAADPLEPQRAIAAWPALVLACGFGWREAWLRARRQRALALLLIALPVLGFAWELRAFDASMLHGKAQYTRSLAWIQMNRDAAAPRIDGSLMPAGLSWEATRPGPALASFDRVWVPVELALELPEGSQSAPPLSLGADSSSGAPDLLVALKPQDPLWSDLALLRRIWVFTPVRDRLAYARALREALPKLQTTLGRAAALRHLLEQVGPLGLLKLEDLQALYAAKIKSPWVFHYVLDFTPRYDLRLTWHLCWLLRQAGGDEALSPTQRALLATDYQSLKPRAGAPEWPLPLKAR